MGNKNKASQQELGALGARMHTRILLLNSVFINEGLKQAERLKRLNLIAIQQMKILLEDRGAKRLEGR